MTEEQINLLAKKIWDYQLLHHKLEKAGCIIGLGSHDIRVAQYCAELYFAGWAPLIMFCGTGFGHRHDPLVNNWSIWGKAEADVFAEIAQKLGVPKDKIIIENKSENTGQNILLAKELLDKLGLAPKKIILVQKPYMERRAYATFKKIWPQKEVIVTSPPISFEEYPNNFRSRQDIINILVGDLQRIKIYPQKGFQIPQEIPADVWDAYEKLVAAGYNKHLIKE